MLEAHDIELVVMAGFGTIFGEAIHARLPRPDPEHPPGAAARRSRAGTACGTRSSYGVKVTGCTVHVATLEVDAGPILAQEAVPVLPDDDEASLHERIKAVERRLYPDTIRAVLADPSLLDQERGDPTMRALLSVYDKTGIVELARGLRSLGLGPDLQRRHGPGAAGRRPRRHRRRRPHRHPRRSSATGW